MDHNGYTVSILVTPNDCGECHIREVEEFVASRHAQGGDILDSLDNVLGERVEGVAAAVLGCQQCHGPAHGILPVAELDSPASPIRQVVTCGDCHETEDRLIDGYLVSVHGRALLKSGLIYAPDCSSCHGAHDILPHSDSRSTVSFQRVPETCGQCHRFILGNASR